MLKGFKLKKVEYWAKKMAQPVQPVEEPVNRLCSSDRVLVEGGQKFLSFPVTFSSWSRFGWGQRSPVKHLMLTTSQPVDP